MKCTIKLSYFNMCALSCSFRPAKYIPKNREKLAYIFDKS